MSIRNYDARPLLHPIDTLRERGALGGFGAIALAGLQLPLAMGVHSEVYQRTGEAWRTEGPGKAVLALLGIGPDAK